MSDALYTTRLRYSTGSGRGIAKLHGISTKLMQPPVLPSLPTLAEVDYVPEIAMGRVREWLSGWRDMEAAEMREADALLRRVVKL